MMPRMVLLVVSLFLACMPTLTSSALSVINRETTGPLEMRLSWGDDAVPAQTYKLTMKDIIGRKLYVVTGVAEKEFLFDDAGQSQLVVGGTPLVFLRSQTY